MITDGFTYKPATLTTEIEPQVTFSSSNLMDCDTVEVLIGSARGVITRRELAAASALFPEKRSVTIRTQCK